MKTAWGAILPMLIVTGCDRTQDNEDAAGGPREAAVNGRIECALEGAKAFERNCTVEEMSGADGTVLVVGRGDVGYRRLRIMTDGRGVIAADGAVPAKVAIVGDGLIEVAIGRDRYRLPANTGGAK